MKIKKIRALQLFGGIFIFSIVLVTLLVFTITNPFAWALAIVSIVAAAKEITAKDFITIIILPTLISLLWWYSNGY